MGHTCDKSHIRKDDGVSLSLKLLSTMVGTSQHQGLEEGAHTEVRKQSNEAGGQLNFSFHSVWDLRLWGGSSILS